MKKWVLVVIIILAVIALFFLGKYILKFTGFAVSDSYDSSSEATNLSTEQDSSLSKPTEDTSTASSITHSILGIIEKKEVLPTEQCPDVDVRVEGSQGSFIVKRGIGESKLSGNLTIHVYVDDSPVNDSDYRILTFSPTSPFGDESTEGRLFIRDYTVGKVSVILRDSNDECP